MLKNPYPHVSHDTVEEFEKTVLEFPSVKPVEGYSKLENAFRFFIFRIFYKFRVNSIPRPLPCFRRNAWKDKGHLFTIIMWVDGPKYRPYVLGNFHNKSVFFFDAWPKEYDRIEEFCKFYKIDYLFISSVQSTGRLQERLPGTVVRYVPEAIDISKYSYSEYKDKDIDVLALGRRWNEHHERIVDGLEFAGISYLYSKDGKLVFPDRESFIDGMSRTKISICVPSNITHPERAGDVETMTVRYLQSMASKCLVLGIAPKEMVALFGYDPVVEIDMEDPVGQIMDILSHFEDYIPLIEKNYKEVNDKHTWRNRMLSMIDIWSQPR